MQNVLGVLGVALSAIGLLVTIRLVYTKTHRTWRATIRDIDVLNRKLTEGNVQFNCVLSFQDGGLIVGELLTIRHHPDIPVVAVVLDIKRDGRVPKQVNIVADSVPAALLRKKSILVVDDVAQSGRSLEAVRSFLIKDLGLPRSRVRTAVLAKLTAIEDVNVDIYATEYEKMIHFPWGKTPRGG